MNAQSITLNHKVGSLLINTGTISITITFEPVLTYDTMMGSVLKLNVSQYDFTVSEAATVKMTIPSGFRINTPITGNEITLGSYTAGTGYSA